MNDTYGLKKVIFSEDEMSQQLQTFKTGEIKIESFSELMMFADYIVRSFLLPKGFTGDHEKKKCDVIAAIQFGSEIGLGKMSSLQHIAVVNGVPTVWGDVPLGLCMGSQLLEDIKEEIIQKDGKLYANCTVKRKGISSPCVSIFSEDDAKTAGLWGKPGPWKTHPKRMLKYKARAFALRDLFPDVLKGLHSAEEMEGEKIITVSSEENMDTIINIMDSEEKKEESEDRLFPLIEKLHFVESIDELAKIWHENKALIVSLNEQEKETITMHKDAIKQKLIKAMDEADISNEIMNSEVKNA